MSTNTKLAQSVRDIDTVLRVEGADLEIGSRRLLKEVQSAVRGAIEALAALAAMLAAATAAPAPEAQAARAALAQRQPLTDEQIAEGRYRMWADELEDAPEPWAFLKGARWAERYYGIGGATIREQRQPLTEWQPIETAPKDGALFFCWVSAVQYGENDEGQQYQIDVSQVDFCQWHSFDEAPEGGWFEPCCGQISEHQQITHWMPLPAAPGATTGEPQR